MCMCTYRGKKIHIHICKLSFGACGTKEERTPSLMPHNPTCSNSLEDYEFIQQEETDTVLSSQQTTDEGN